MNYQTDKYDLQRVTAEEAIKLLDDSPPYLTYYAVPTWYPNTAGPFSKPGTISGQAFSLFTVEYWVCPVTMQFVKFCKGKVVEVGDDFNRDIVTNKSMF